MKSNRDRAEGWTHAKLSGHKNEDNIKDLILNNEGIQQRILDEAGHSASGVRIADVEIGGINEMTIPSILGDSTKNKSDIKVILSDGGSINISIKKSLAGQVYLITPERFIEGFSKIYNTEIPAAVKRAIELFWGTAADVPQILRSCNTGKDSIDAYQLRKHRLVKSSMDKYDNTLSSSLLEWFKSNIKNIFDFCFARGLAKDPENSADLIWYINTLGEHDVDCIMNIKRVKSRIAADVLYGNRSGGTTIQLPFGFVQWHDPSHKCPCMQFHHDYEKISALMKQN